jgi:hypothetical protein
MMMFLLSDSDDVLHDADDNPYRIGALAEKDNGLATYVEAQAVERECEHGACRYDTFKPEDCHCWNPDED